MFTVEIAGVLHNDPLGPRRLTDWFQNLATHRIAPAFIAVEWDEETWRSVIAQRTTLEELVLSHLPESTAHFAATLSRGLGYEADCHQGAFPEARVLWLDSGRVAPTGSVK